MERDPNQGFWMYPQGGVPRWVGPGEPTGPPKGGWNQQPARPPGGWNWPPGTDGLPTPVPREDGNLQTPDGFQPPGGPIGQPPPGLQPFDRRIVGPGGGPPRTGGPDPIEGGGGGIYQMPPWLRGGGASTMPMPPGDYGGGMPGGGSPSTMPMPPGNYGGNPGIPGGGSPFTMPMPPGNYGGGGGMGVPGGGSPFPMPMPRGNYGGMTPPPTGQPNQGGLQALLSMLMNRRKSPAGPTWPGGGMPFGGGGSNVPYSF